MLKRSVNEKSAACSVRFTSIVITLFIALSYDRSLNQLKSLMTFLRFSDFFECDFFEKSLFSAFETFLIMSVSSVLKPEKIFHLQLS